MLELDSLNQATGEAIMSGQFRQKGDWLIVARHSQTQTVLVSGHLTLDHEFLPPLQFTDGNALELTGGPYVS